MLEQLMKLYVMAMAGQVYSPLPHMFGPPGCGKSSVCYQLAELVQKKLHVVNVSRLSPLEIEGVQMPTHENTRLTLLTATFWTQLEDGDILLLDEFLRGFPEVYNGLLDILTAREVGGFKLPNVFIVAASNSTIAYDKALEDRLLHLPVPDPRKVPAEKRALAKRVVDSLGLLPEMATSMEMQSLLDTEVLPMFDVLDSLGPSRGAATPGVKGTSIRKLIGQALLREVQSAPLRELIAMNNQRAINAGKYQFVLLLDGKTVDKKYASTAPSLVGNKKLTPQQATQLSLNLQLIEMEAARKASAEKEEDIDDDDIFGA